ncbi:uncharacterized protein LOC106661385 isoform X2 [Cimex lectularius]|uniref:Uncharacterized protein n=1 Tax=Cimex lectularius TaxID=79782 RepID=A0A8I6R816_CIMLE|nr:uncharacterized protein LOC106661385 isoform X2 [Cimex lectularius]
MGQIQTLTEETEDEPFDLGATSSTGATVIFQNESYRSSSEERSVGLGLADPEKRTYTDIDGKGKHSPHKKLKRSNKFESNDCREGNSESLFRDLAVFRRKPDHNDWKHATNSARKFPLKRDRVTKGDDGDIKFKGSLSKFDVAEDESELKIHQTKTSIKQDKGSAHSLNEIIKQRKPHFPKKPTCHKDYLDDREDNFKEIDVTNVKSDKSLDKISRTSFVLNVKDQSRRPNIVGAKTSHDKLRKFKLKNNDSSTILGHDVVRKNSSKSSVFQIFKNARTQYLVPNQVIQISSEHLIAKRCATRDGTLPKKRSEFRTGLNTWDDRIYSSSESNTSIVEMPKTAPSNLGSPTVGQTEDSESDAFGSKSETVGQTEKKSYKTFPNSCLKSTSSHSGNSRTKSSVRFKLDEPYQNKAQDMARKSARMEPFPHTSESFKAKGDSNEGSLEEVRDQIENDDEINVENVLEITDLTISLAQEEQEVDNEEYLDSIDCNEQSEQLDSSVIVLYCNDVSKDDSISKSEGINTGNSSSDSPFSSGVEEQEKNKVKQPDKPVAKSKVQCKSRLPQQQNPVKPSSYKTGNKKAKERPNAHANTVSNLKTVEKPASRSRSLEAKKKEIRDKLLQLDANLERKRCGKNKQTASQSKPNSPRNKPIWKPISPCGSSSSGNRPQSPTSPRRFSSKSPQSTVIQSVFTADRKQRRLINISEKAWRPSSPQTLSTDEQSLSSVNAKFRENSSSLFVIDENKPPTPSISLSSSVGSVTKTLTSAGIKNNDPTRPKTSDGTFRSYGSRMNPPEIPKQNLPASRQRQTLLKNRRETPGSNSPTCQKRGPNTNPSPPRQPLARNNRVTSRPPSPMSSSQYNTESLQRPTSRKPHLSPNRPQSVHSPRVKSPCATPRTNLTLQKTCTNAEKIKNTIEQQLNMEELNSDKTDTPCLEGNESENMPSSCPETPNSPASREACEEPSLQTPPTSPTTRKVGHPLRNMTLKEFQNRRQKCSTMANSLENSAGTSAGKSDKSAYKPPWVRNSKESPTHKRPESPIFQKPKTPVSPRKSPSPARQTKPSDD